MQCGERADNNSPRGSTFDVFRTSQKIYHEVSKYFKLHVNSQDDSQSTKNSQLSVDSMRYSAESPLLRARRAGQWICINRTHI